MEMGRQWAMPNSNTFDIPPIGALLRRWLLGKQVIIDPFAGNSSWGNVTNDLDKTTSAQSHLLADVWLSQLSVTADAVLFDPPYSPRQITECYKRVGLKTHLEDTQNARLYRNVRDGLDRLLKPDGIALSFGWNSGGFGTGRGYRILEILLVCHGGAHNDTICVVERKVA